MVGGCLEVDTDPQAGVGGFAGETQLGEKVELPEMGPVGFKEDRVFVRKSEIPDVILVCTREEWRFFITAVKAGEFDV
jgi:hypothetical protein